MHPIIFASVVALLLLGGVARADVSISDKPTQNMSCSGGVCTATAQKAVLNVTDLQSMLASGDATVKTGSVTDDIGIDRPFAWASTSRLTLDARQSVVVRKPVTVTGTGALTITTSDGGSGGDLYFTSTGKITFRNMSSSFVFDGNSYILVNSIEGLAQSVASNASGLYALARDYDASRDGEYTTSPIPTTFTGTFEALGHQISNLDISTTEQQMTGLFAENSGVIRHLGVENANVSSTASSEFNYTGIVAAINYFGSIVGSHATGSVHDGSDAVASTSVGGLAGLSRGAILNSYAAVSIGIDGNGSAKFIGGLVGFVDDFIGLVDRSYAAGSISVSATPSPHGQKYYEHIKVGGLVGLNIYGTISLSHAGGSVAGTGVRSAGGLVGEDWWGTVDRSYSAAEVTVSDEGATPCNGAGGGLVGMEVSEGSPASIANSFALGSVSVGDSGCAGGLVGESHDMNSAVVVSASYAIGAVAGGQNAAIGGALGMLQIAQGGGISKVYWDKDTSGTEGSCGKGRCVGAKGLTDAKLKARLPDGFDPSIWGQSPNINNGYPYLLANPPPT